MKNVLLLLSTVLIFISCSTNNNGTVTVVPIAPTNLTGSVISTSQVNLSWTDNATNEDGYKIERKSGSGSYAVVGSMGVNLTTFGDLGLRPNTTYTYRVYAYNSAGNSLQYSNEVTVTTQDNIPSWLTNGLVAFYPFSGNAVDSSGNGNNGTNNGATLTNDRNGNPNSAYFFSGAACDTRIDAQINTTTISTSNEYSVSFWVKKMGDGCMIHPRIMEFFDPNNIGALQLSWDVSGPNVLMVETGNSTSNYLNLLYSIPNWLNEWHQMVVVCNTSELKLYDNGINVNTAVFTGLPRLASSVSFGRMNHPSYNTFQGCLDDIRIYNRALSQSEVSYLATH